MSPGLAREKRLARVSGLTGSLYELRAMLTALTRSAMVFGHFSLRFDLMVEGWLLIVGIANEDCWDCAPLGFWYSGRSQWMRTVGFFFAAFGVESDKAFEDFGVGQSGGPAVGGEDGGVEVVVELTKDGDEALVVDLFLFFGEQKRRGGVCRSGQNPFRVQCARSSHPG